MMLGSVRQFSWICSRRTAIVTRLPKLPNYSKCLFGARATASRMEDREETSAHEFYDDSLQIKEARTDRHLEEQEPEMRELDADQASEAIFKNLLDEMLYLADSGNVSGAERLLLQYAPSTTSSSGLGWRTVAAAASLPSLIQHDVHRAMILASVNACNASLTAQWLQAFHETRNASQDMEKDDAYCGCGEILSSQVLGRMLAVVARDGGPDETDRWFAALEEAGHLAQRVRYRLALRARIGIDETGLEFWFSKLLSAKPALPALDQSLGSEELLWGLARGLDPTRVVLWQGRLQRLSLEGVEQLADSQQSRLALLHAWARQGDVAAAEKAFESLGLNMKFDGQFSEQQHLLTKDAELGIEDLEGKIRNLSNLTEPFSVDSAVADDHDVKLRALNLLLLAFAHAADPDKAGKWLKQIETAGLKPNSTSFRHVLKACAKAGDYGSAEAWISGMSGSFLSPGNLEYNYLLRACASEVSGGNDAKRASEWIRRMLFAGEEPDVFGLNAVISAHAKVGDHSSASNLLEAMEAGLDGAPAPDAASYASVASAFSAAASLCWIEGG
eukprot:TRINITY_DN13493_c0_g2_i2.p1 TRINITY_DN13493_c0_g2~~TRINITY_DN13493_c0_g2_i2.p1  ORF type:complete len:560 (-),score=134.98 TRINITY_DN13493_c0_g2_i2:476-2155(-)